MKKLLTTVLFSFSVLALSAQKLAMDPAHSQLNFDVSHMTISEVSGHFATFDVTVESTKEDFTDAKFKVTADVNSISTGVEARDNHLKSEDFFDVEKYSQLTFITISTKKGKKNNFTITGNLTMHGVTRTVALNAEYRGSVLGQDGKRLYGFIITGQLKRSDFEIGSKFSNNIIGDVINLKSSLEFKES